MREINRKVRVIRKEVSDIKKIRGETMDKKIDDFKVEGCKWRRGKGVNNISMCMDKTKNLLKTRGAIELTTYQTPR